MPTCDAPEPVRFEHRSNPLGVGTATPRLSWRIPSAEPGFEMTACAIEATRDGSSTPEIVTLTGPDQILVPWPFAPLTSRERVSVRVRVASGEDWSDWSEPATVEAGLLSPGDWQAAFISPREHGALGAAAPVLHGNAVATGGVTRARLYITAHGLYRAEINGVRVGDEVLAPGWTSYSHRLRYQTYDVTDLVHDGDNAIDVALGNGWYRGRLSWEGKRAFYGERLALLAQLEVEYGDGSTQTFGTGTDWLAGDSQILHDDLYDGQTTDLSMPVPAPSGAVDVVDGDFGTLVAPDGPGVVVTEVVPAMSVFRSPSGATLVDFGQNLVGWVRLRVKGAPAGHRVVVRHAEVLENGELGVRPLRSARAIDEYVLSGSGDETLEPEFTFHGFRYAEITGGGDVAPGDVEAVVVGSGLERTGWFDSSHEELNQLHKNVVWSMRGNFVDVPTDCPQRDERMGWTGDIQVFSPTATFLFDTAGFLTSWLRDLAAEQFPNGSVPFVVPDVLYTADPSAAAWGDAATVVPWVLYQRFGDVDVLRSQFSSMVAWVDRIADLAGADRLWTGGFQFGDWLDPTAPPEDAAKAKADPDIVATAHLARSADILAQTAEILGETAMAEKYSALAARVREAFAFEYVTPSGRISSDAQTIYALAIEWALLPGDAQRAGAGQRLADLVRSSGFRISTGFVGTPLIADALSSSGHTDVAYSLLLERGNPSWLYPVTMGATTIWERWDSMLPDGSINPGGMTSFNHYALGAVADWMHRSVAGLAPATPGYREILVRPLLDAALAHASATHITPYGKASVGWQRSDGVVTLQVTVPVGSTAVVHVPGTEDVHTVHHGSHEWTVTDPTT